MSFYKTMGSSVNTLTLSEFIASSTTTTPQSQKAHRTSGTPRFLLNRRGRIRRALKSIGSMYFRTSPIFSVLIITLLIVGGSGVPHLGMHMEMDGSMNADCFMPGMTAICQISPLEHIAAWKVTFAALPWQKDIASLLLLLLAFSVGLVCWINKIPIRPPSLQRVPARYARKEYLPPANPFQELFSNGILHSKVF